MSIVIYYTIVILFTFSGRYSGALWPSIIFLKFVQIIIEYVLGGILDDDLLLAPLQMMLNTLITLATMGASHFLEFLFSYFIALGLMMGERCYVVLVQEFLTEFLTSKYKLLV